MSATQVENLCAIIESAAPLIEEMRKILYWQEISDSEYRDNLVKRIDNWQKSLEEPAIKT